MRSAKGSRIGRSAPAHNSRSRGHVVDGVLERRYLTRVRAQPRARSGDRRAASTTGPSSGVLMSRGDVRLSRRSGCWFDAGKVGRRTGINPGNKLSATDANSGQLEAALAVESGPVQPDPSGWGPGGRRFKSCLPDRSPC